MAEDNEGFIDFSRDSENPETATGEHVRAMFVRRFPPAPDQSEIREIQPEHIDFNKPIMFSFPGYLVHNRIEEAKDIEQLREYFAMVQERAGNPDPDKVQVLIAPYPDVEDEKELFDQVLKLHRYPDGTYYSQYSERIACVCADGIMDGKDINEIPEHERMAFIEEVAKRANNITVDGFSVGATQAHLFEKSIMHELEARGMKREEISYIVGHICIDGIGDLGALTEAGPPPYPGARKDSYLATGDDFHRQKLNGVASPDGNDKQLYDLSPDYLIIPEDMPNTPIASISLDPSDRSRVTIGEVPKIKMMVSVMTVDRYRDHLAERIEDIMTRGHFSLKKIAEELGLLKEIKDLDGLVKKDPDISLTVAASAVVKIDKDKGTITKAMMRHDPKNHMPQTYMRTAVPVGALDDEKETFASPPHAELIPQMAQKTLAAKLQASIEGAPRINMDFQGGPDPEGVFGLAATDASGRIKAVTVNEKDLAAVGVKNETNIARRFCAAGKILDIRRSMNQIKEAAQAVEGVEPPRPASSRKVE